MKKSNFSKFVKKFIDENISVANIGSGNEKVNIYHRIDTPTLQEKWSVIDIEKSNGLSIEDAMKRIKAPSLLYMRFFVHCIEDNVFQDILNWATKWIAIEVRSNKNSTEYKTYNHKRYYRSSTELLKRILDSKFEIMYFIESQGLAVFKKENPTIIRIIAKKYE